MARVGLVFGGRSVEHEVSVRSARTVQGALDAGGHEVVPLAVGPDGGWLSPRRAAAALAGGEDRLASAGEPILDTLRHLTAARPEIVFPVVHGTWGEDGTLQGLCEMLDLPYVGAGVAASALAMDKVRCKRQLAAVGLPVVDDEVVTAADLAADEAGCLARSERLPLPLFVKPGVGGSSVGVVKVERRDELAAALRFALRFDTTALVERGVVGRELECAVLGNERPEASAVGEIVPGASFYDYADKYVNDSAELNAPAELPDAVAERVGELACRAFGAVGCSGMARVDFLLEGESDLHLNEINTLPGFTEISMYPRLWGISGLELPRLASRLLELGFARHAERRGLDDAIKGWLAEL